MRYILAVLLLFAAQTLAQVDLDGSTCSAVAPDGRNIEWDGCRDVTPIPEPPPPEPEPEPIPPTCFGSCSESGGVYTCGYGNQQSSECAVGYTERRSWFRWIYTPEIEPEPEPPPAPPPEPEPEPDPIPEPEPEPEPNGEYARGVPYPDFGWDPLTYDPPTTRTTASLPSSVSSGEVILYTGTSGGAVQFNCNEAAPCILKGQDQTLSSGLRLAGKHFVVDGFKFYNTSTSVNIAGSQSNPVAYAVVRNMDHGGNNTGTSNGTAMWSANAHDIVFFSNKIHNLKQDSGTSEVDFIGFVPRHNASNMWYLDNDVWRLGGDAIRTGTNVSRLGAGNSPPKHIYIAKNRFHDMGENPIDLKYATEIVISGNELYGAQSSVSSSGELITIHESGDRVYIYDNNMHDGARGVVTATSGGGADYIEVDGNRMSNLSQYGVYNRGGGHADVTNNVFTNVAIPIQTNADNGSTTFESGNVVN